MTEEQETIIDLRVRLIASEQDQNTLDEANIRLNEKYLELKAAADKMFKVVEREIRILETAKIKGSALALKLGVKNYKQKFGCGDL